MKCVFEAQGYWIFEQGGDLTAPVNVVFAHGNDPHAFHIAQSTRQRKLVVVGAPQDWFQNPVVFDALDQHCSQSSHVTAIGAQAGAYAALRWAERRALESVIALSPIVTINPRIGPQDWRFDEDFARLGRFHEISHFKALRYSFVYDPGSPEKRHMDYLAAPKNGLAVRLPGSVGIADRIFHEADSLEFALGCLRRRGVRPWMRRNLRDARLRSPSYLAQLGARNHEMRPAVYDWAQAQIDVLYPQGDLIAAGARQIA